MFAVVVPARESAGVMRFRKTTVVVSAGAVLGLLVALWPRAAPRLPQVNLLHLSRTEQTALSLPAEPFEWSTANLFVDPQEGLSAEFEICTPEGPGVVLSGEKVNLDSRGLQGGGTAAAAKDTTIKLKDPFANPPATLQIGMNRVQVF